MSNITAMLTVLEYSINEPIIYEPIQKIFSKNNEYIDISILVSVVTKELKERKLTINMVYAEPLEDGKTIRIHPAFLKEFIINKENDINRVQISNLLSEFASHRNDIKFNLKNIRILGKGIHTIVLDELSEKEVTDNPKLIMEKAIASYSFDVR